MLRRLWHAIYRRLDGVGYARSIGVTVGRDCRLLHVTFSTEAYLVTLGDHVSATHTHFETHDGGVWVFRGEAPEIDLIRPIRVGDNVFIGRGSVILPGVTIGSNVVIGAGSIVARDIPGNCVAAGAPAVKVRDLADYRDKAFSAGVMTKPLTPAQKRSFLLKAR